MRIHYLKLSNMTHSLSLNVFIAFKGTNFYIFIGTNIKIQTTVTKPKCGICLYQNRLFHIVLGLNRVFARGNNLMYLKKNG